MTTTTRESKLIEILRGLDPDMLLNDGAATWTADNLLDAALANDEEDKPTPYVATCADDGMLQICKLKDDGYLESVASYTEVHGDA